MTSMTPLSTSFEQPLQRRPLHGPAREPAVVVAVADEDPALVLLALDVGERRLPLGVQRIELHVQPLVGGDAGVDGGADFADRRFHLAEWFRRPKNSGPFQRVPVITRAIGDSDVYSPPLVLVAVLEHGGGVLDALPFPDQPGSDDRAIAPARLGTLPLTRRSSSSISSLSFASARADKPAVGQFLDPIRQPLDQERLVVGRRLAIIEVAPQLLKLRRRFLWQRGDLG